MQSPQVFDIQPTPKTPTNPFRSDSSCFSPLANLKGIPPKCAFCANDAVGGMFVDMDSGYPLGQVTGTVEFDCGCQGQKSYAIRVENIDQWKLFRNITPGVFRVKKKMEAERMKEQETR